MCLSVVIVSHGHGSQLENTLVSLQNNYHSGSQFTTHLLLNIPEKKETENFLEQLPLPIIIYKNDKAYGLSHNLNRLLAKIDTPFFLILNPDVRLPDYNIEICLTALRKSKSALLTCPSRTLQDQELPNIRYYPSIISIFQERLFCPQKRLRCFHNILARPNSRSFWFQGSYLMGLTATAQQIRFDEQFFLYFEDVDFCRRILARGLKLSICSDTFFWHHFNRRSSKLCYQHCYQHIKSALYYFYKYRGRIEPALDVGIELDVGAELGVDTGTGIE